MPKFNYKEKYEFDYGPDSFKPTATSELLLESIVKDKVKLGKTLDVGTGIGFVIIMLDLYEKIDQGSGASDISLTNINYCNQNIKSLKSKVTTRLGSLLEPWSNVKFDTIINDVSGVVPDVATKSGWFDGVPVDCGEDGAELTTRFIAESMEHLNIGGTIYTPVLSLQNENRIYQTLEKFNLKYQTIDSKFWFLPPNLASEEELLKRLSSLGYIRLDNKFGKLCWYTTILRLERN